MGRFFNIIRKSFVISIVCICSLSQARFNPNEPITSFNNESLSSRLPILTLASHGLDLLGGYCLEGDTIQSVIPHQVCTQRQGSSCLDYRDQIIEIPLTQNNEFCSQWKVRNEQSGNIESFGVDYPAALAYYSENSADSQEPFCEPDQYGWIELHPEFETTSSFVDRPEYYQVQFYGRAHKLTLERCEDFDARVTMDNGVILTGGEHSGNGQRARDK